MNKNKEKVKCNKCGNEQIIDGEEIICSNCHNIIDIKLSKINADKSDERIIYEIQNKLIEDEECNDLLIEAKKRNINNNLIKYLDKKNNKEYDFFEINDNTEYLEYILKDILRSTSYTKEERIRIINSSELKNKSKYLSIIDESIYKQEKTQTLVDDLYKENILIVKNKFEKAGDLTFIKISISIMLLLLIFLFGFFFDNDLANPIVIILSIIPSIILAFIIGFKIKTKNCFKIIYTILLIFVLFYLISYIETIRINGFIGLKEHLNNIINAVPNFINELLERMENLEDFDIKDIVVK